MGININGDYNSVNVVYGDVNYGGEPPSNPPIGFFGIVFFVVALIWLIVKFWWIALIAASLGAIIFAAWLERQEKLEDRRREEELAARAERQNSAYLRGEPWGLYGSFPPG